MALAPNAWHVDRWRGRCAWPFDALHGTSDTASRQRDAEINCTAKCSHRFQRSKQRYHALNGHCRSCCEPFRACQPTSPGYANQDLRYLRNVLRPVQGSADDVAVSDSRSWRLPYNQGGIVGRLHYCLFNRDRTRPRTGGSSDRAMEGNGFGPAQSCSS
ncbi:hypothetical protein D3C72_1371650 [compost metagenome]